MRRITTRLALLLASAGVVPLLAYGAVSIISLRASTNETVTQGNLNVARRSAEQIELHIINSIKTLKAVAAVAADLQQTGLETWRQDRILENFVLQFPEFAELTLLDAAGTAVVSSRVGTPTVSVPGSDSVDIHGALMSRFTVDDDLLPTATVAVRLSTTQGERGWLVGRLNLEELRRMVDRIRVGNEGVALLVSARGQLLAHGGPDEKAIVARQLNPLTHPVMQALHSGNAETAAAAEYGSPRGQMLGVAAVIPALDWALIVEQPQAEAYAVARRQQWQLGIAIGLALLAMIGVGYNVGRGVIEIAVSRP